ncbi:MAG: hypothetical protein RLZZ312_271 [Bacteroidota bacterium]|jgi:UPF0176 protein
MQLYNTLSADERKTLIDQSGKQRLTLSFYAYSKIENPTQFRNELFLAWQPLDVLGRIYVAHEGINAQLSLPADQFYNFKNSIETYQFMQDIRLNVAVEHDDFSFLKLTIKVRDKIVADGLNDDTFDSGNIGIHLKANEFNKMLDDPDTIVVDMRNHYESEIGHFAQAIRPDVDTFRESLPIIENQLANHKTDKKLLMYCTGGIRCEKASAYFKHRGFENVYQLEGGIIEYTRQVKAEGLESKFIGKNFVFDQRLGERITEDIVSKCHQCGTPCDNHTNCVNDGCHLLFIQCDSCKAKTDNCCSHECQTTIQLPLDKQVKLRSGIMNGNKIFKKGKSEIPLFKNEPGAISNIFSLSGNDKKPQPTELLIGRATHFYTKASIGQFEITNGELKIGDFIIIKGKTTGQQELILKSMIIFEKNANNAASGDVVTIELPFKIRLSDKLFKKI